MPAIRRWLPRPYLSLCLVVLWLLLENTLAPGHILLAVILGWLIPYATHDFWPESLNMHKPLLAFKFLMRLLWDILIANWAVARMILSPHRRLQPAFITYPLLLKKDFTITLLANTISMTPGTVATDLTRDRKALIIHSLHVQDIDAAIAEIHQRYELPLKEIFEC